MEEKMLNKADFNRYGFVLLFFLSLLLTADSAHAQYFGQNKVQYKTFNFKVLKTEHFDVYYYPEERAAAEQAARMAERWYARHAKMFDHELSRRQPFILYASHPGFEQTNAISGQLGEGTGGVTEALKRRMVIPVGNTLDETNHVIGHELVHAFQYDMTGEGYNARVGFAAPTALRMPLWFIEGMAEYMSLGPIDPNTAMWMRDAVKNEKKLPDLKKLEDPRFFPYRYGQALLAYIGGRWGDDAIGELLKEAGKSGNLDPAIRKVLAISPDTLAMDWHQALHDAYDPLLKETKTAADYGKVLIKAKGEGTDLNVAPALSPDGKQLIFMSSRSLFSIDIYLADAQTGKIGRKITSNALDPHFESLQFIYSAGDWDATGNRIVFAAVTKGEPIITILKVKEDKIEREIKIKEVDEIFNPTWSPDGRYIAFSALNGGYTDLFIYDLQTDKLRKMTDDPFTDMHPAWSPDGKKIAFSTDRFSTKLSNLDIGNYRLALLDPTTGAIEQLADFEDGKNINPQWSPDSRSLYFISDHNGISNLYRLEINSGIVSQLTNLYTGVSGITSISPAISVATKEGKLALSAYEDGKYSIYTIDTLQTMTGNEITAKDGETGWGEENPAILPPQKRTSDSLLTLLHDPNFGLPDSSAFAVKKYHPGLSLDYIGQPYLAVGADRFGTFIGGGVSLFWSDLLGDHNLATALQVSGNFKDITALAAYENTKHRWNWGALVQQVPYITGSFASGYGIVNGDTALVEEQIIQRQFNREVTGVFQYPFSRSSRFEFSAGYNNISFSQDLETQAFSLLSGQRILNQKNNLPAPGALNFFQGDAAYVYDNTYFGATSPILGQRYRFEVSPTVGSLTFFNVLADYRKYFMPLKPYTLAFRVLHYGRYGHDGEDYRLSPLFLGYPGLVRGYDFYSFSPNECPTNDCEVINQLFGSRMAVFNAELRVPLWNLLTLGHGFFYGYLPIEIAGFYDAGVAWTSANKAFFLDGSRNLVSSAGVAMRLSLGGYVVFEWDFVHPYDRPAKNWLWQFSITPGF